MLAFARVALVRLVRDRTNVFFMLLFPLLIVLLVGMQFSGGGTTRLGIVDGVLGDDLRAALLEQDLELVALDDADDARTAVEDGAVDAAVVLPSVASVVSL